MGPAETVGPAGTAEPGQWPESAKSPEVSSAGEGAALAVEVLWSPERGQWRRLALSLPDGSTVVEALRASQWFDEGTLRTLKTGIWSKLRPLDTPLRHGDRVEVYRPLTVDPKEARRQRYQATGRRIVTRHRPLGKKA